MGWLLSVSLEERPRNIVYDIFILNMNNRTVQEKHCTQPKEYPEEGLQFVVAFEKGVQRQKLYGMENEVKARTKPVCVVEQSSRKNCFRCGFVFSQEHVQKCKAVNQMCNKCGMLGHYARCCKKEAKKGREQMRRVNWFAQDESTSETSESDLERVVLHVDDVGSEPFRMKGCINGQKLKIVIDSGSPITNFTVEETLKIFRTNLLFMRKLPADEINVDFNQKPLPIIGHFFCHVKVGQKQIKKARVLVSQRGAKSIIGREWLSAPHYSVREKKVNAVGWSTLLKRSGPITKLRR